MKPGGVPSFADFVASVVSLSAEVEALGLELE